MTVFCFKLNPSLKVFLVYWILGISFERSDIFFLDNVMSCLFLHKAPQALARELNKSSPVDLSPSVTLVILQKLIARLSIRTILHIFRDIAIMLKPSLDLTSLDRIELYF